MSIFQFSVWVFPIINTTVISTITFKLINNRPVTGVLIGIVVGFLIGLITKILSDEYYINFSHRLDNKMKASEIMTVPRIFAEVWIIPIKRLFRFAGKFMFFFILLAIVFYLLLKAVLNGL